MWSGSIAAAGVSGVMACVGDMRVGMLVFGNLVYFILYLFIMEGFKICNKVV